MRPRVWAPRAHKVELRHGTKRTAMKSAAGGWWQAEIELQPGDDYAFALDGGAPRPDPRSQWQPRGVHEASRVFDPAAFAWGDAGWRPPVWSSAVIYELHLGTFSPEGTFDGARAQLEHLKELGITHIEIMPIAAFPGARGWGYDGVSLFAVHEAYGGPEACQRFVDACHARGLAVILDVVYNHLGPSGNYLAGFGPYFTDRYHTPWGAAINLDGADSHEVRAFFIANAVQWLRDFHIDGLRLDAVHAIQDTAALTFLEELAATVRGLEAMCGRPLTLVAESDANDPRLSLPAAAGGVGLDAQWNEDFHHALHAALTGERAGYYQDFGSLPILATVLERGFYLDGRYSKLRRRRHGRPMLSSDGARLVVYTQNHDQTGNRALGERTSQLLSPGLLRIAAALTLLSPFVPLIFQGEEWGASTPFLYFTDHAEPELAAAVRQGRPPESPDPQAANTFARSRLRWEELAIADHAGLWEWYRALIRLRRTSTLTTHEMHGERARANERQRWLTMARGPWRIACNLAPHAQPVPLGTAGTRWQVVLASTPLAAASAGEAVPLPPESVAILRAAE